MSAIVAYYGTPESDAAVDTAVSYARQYSTGVVLLLAARTTTTAQMSDEVEDRMWRYLQDSGVPFEVRRQCEDQDMADQAMRLAEEIDATVLVIGIRSGSSGCVSIGPTATRILLEAPVPVVTTRAHFATAHP